MTTAQLIALLSSPLAPLVIGLIGSGIEKLGLQLSWPRLVAVGKALEAIAADLPKLITNLKTVAVGKPKDPPVPPSGGEAEVGTVDVFPQTSDGKPLSVRPEAGMDAEYRVWRHAAWRFLAGTGCAAFLLACASTPPAKAPCDERTIAIMTTECAARAFECGQNGTPKDECVAIRACKAEIDARQQECRQ